VGGDDGGGVHGRGRGAQRGEHEQAVCVVEFDAARSDFSVAEKPQARVDL